jgi:thioredoxin-dependent peroxiredoxin
MLTPGTVAPDFTLPDEGGSPIALADLRGRWVLLWWYPKAATPG